MPLCNDCLYLHTFSNLSMHMSSVGCNRPCSCTVRRAERFGTQYKDPATLPKFAQEARKERFRREGFATGIDLFSEASSAHQTRAHISYLELAAVC